MSNEIIKIDSLSVSFNSREIIKDLSFSFEKCKIYGLTGESGCGKTTLINSVAGLVKKQRGEIYTSFEKVGYLFQEARLFPWLTAIDNVSLICKDEAKAKKYLELFLPDDMSKYPHELSGGMQQRVSLARAMAYEADFYLIDEPFKGLDPDTRDYCAAILSDFLKGKGGIIVTHDEKDTKLCDTVLKMSGRPVSQLLPIA